MNKIKNWLILPLLIFFSVNNIFANSRESTVCGWFQERFLFQMWSLAAPSPDESRIKMLKYVENVKFTTSDNKILNGYVYHSYDKKLDKKIKAKGYVLMTLGNAMIADSVIKNLKFFAQNGYDVYIYDYRGYGLSQGKRRINAIIEDYKEIVLYHNKNYDKSMLYGISLGGAIMMNVIGSGVKFHRAVIDSSPSKFSHRGCPKKIDPIENIPKDSKNILIITGQLDQVLNENMTSELRILAKSKNATTYDGKEYAHPFMDKNTTTHNERLIRVFNFLNNN